MKLLLDTVTFLWLASGDERLSERAAQLALDPEHELFLSAISAWEIAVKHALGKLPLPERPEVFVPRHREHLGAEPLPLTERAALALTRLPRLHTDPFDRMLVCQALADGLTLLTPDPQLRAYPALTEW